VIIYRSTARNRFTGTGIKFGCRARAWPAWIQLASEWLKPIYREIKEQMMSGPYIQVDETPIKYLDPGNGKTGQGYQ
jgi:hypothetical protein